MKARHVDVFETKEITREKFSYISGSREPIVLRGLHIGPCVDVWNADYLCSKYGTVDCVAQVSTCPKMNFLDKNFIYKKMSFFDLVKKASSPESHEPCIGEHNEHYYFRSLGEDVRKDPSNFHKQFSHLADDISFPKLFPEEQFFSSIFRMASKGTQLWTHYDVMDNMLIQIVGDKRVVLFPPSDALNLYMKGDKSLVTDIDNPDLNKYPKFASANPYTCTLKPGDVLFIPALWFHNVTSLDFGVAVNVFWKNLENDLYDKKDVYGNKDLIPAARGMDVLNRALGMLKHLPPDYKDFYGRRMIQRIDEKLLTPRNTNN